MGWNSNMIKYGRFTNAYGLELLDENTVRKTASAWREENFDFMSVLCKHLMAHPNPLIIPVLDFQEIPRKNLKVENWQSNREYFYDMPRCGDISHDEKLVVDQVWSAYHRHGRIEHEKAEKYPALMSFLEEVIIEDHYHDLHSGNIMTFPDSKYGMVLIDLEGFTALPLNRPENDWITKHVSP
jgi:hypothetical protein